MNKKLLTSVIAAIVCATLIIVAVWMAVRPSVSTLERAKESVKLVVHLKKSGQVIGAGSAFIINNQGCLVTSAHVVCEQSKTESGLAPLTPEDVHYVFYEKQTSKGRFVVMQKATVEGMDASRDLAWLRVNPDRMSLRPLKLSRKATVGTLVNAIGFPMEYDFEKGATKLLFTALWEKIISSRNGQNILRLNQECLPLPWTSEWSAVLDASVPDGAISDVRTTSTMHTGQGKDAMFAIITHSATLQGGMSGSPLVDKNGDVVGVNFARLATSIRTEQNDTVKVETNNNSAISVTELRHFLETRNIPFWNTGDNPDGFITTVRTYLDNARPHQIALVAIGSLVALCAITSIIILIVSSMTKTNNDMEDGGVDDIDSDDINKTVPISSDGPTIPFADRTQEVYLVLMGKDPDGHMLRFKFTEKELQQRRTLLIGRSSCDIILPFQYISRQQARLTYEQDSAGNGILYLQDENSKNTTCLNGIPLQSRCSLVVGDKITMGPVTLTLSVE